MCSRKRGKLLVLFLFHRLCWSWWRRIPQEEGIFEEHLEKEHFRTYKATFPVFSLFFAFTLLFADKSIMLSLHASYFTSFFVLFLELAAAFWTSSCTLSASLFRSTAAPLVHFYFISVFRVTCGCSEPHLKHSMVGNFFFSRACLDFVRLVFLRLNIVAICRYRWKNCLGGKVQFGSNIASEIIQ